MTERLGQWQVEHQVQELEKRQEERELEQKAEEYAEKLSLVTLEDMKTKDIVKKSYKDGYEQGRIDFSHCVFFEQVCKESDKLAKENEELKAQNEILVKDLQTAIDTNRQWLKRDTALEEQIEKMRNCPNCNKKGCNLEIAKRKECIDNNNSLWEWELAE